MYVLAFSMATRQKKQHKPRDAEASVRRLVKKNENYEHAKAHVREIERVQANAMWSERDSAKIKTSAEDDAHVMTELELVNEQLLKTRRAEIQALYDEDMRKWQPMLEAKGLSIIFDRSM